MNNKIKSIGSIYTLAIDGKKFISISKELKKEREKLFGFDRKEKLNRKEYKRFGTNIGERASLIRKVKNKENITMYYDEVISRVSQDFKIEKNELMSKTRRQDILEVRQLIQFILYLFYPISFVKISIYFKQDHTTVRNSIQKMSHEIKYNDKYKLYIENLINEMEMEIQ